MQIVMQKKVGVAGALILMLMLIGICKSEQILATDNGTKEEVSLLNPFDYSKMVVNPKAISTVVVLRSNVPLRSAIITAPSINTGTHYIFRNSVVRCPIAPEVRSGMLPE